MSDERTHNLIVFPGLKRDDNEPVVPDGDPVELHEPPVDAADATVEPLLGETLAAPRPEFLQAAVEAVLFASDAPVSFESLAKALGEPPPEALRGAISTLRESYLRRGAGLRLHEVADGYQLRTVAQAAPYVAAARGARPFRLSKAAVETLAIVAYRQPVTRTEVEDIRGVDSGGIMRTLLEKQLLAVMGRREEPGRPLLYGTTPLFLELFGLKDLSDLPTLRDLRELQSDDPREGPVQLDFPDF
ncbi:MAG: SMC-Scp complex subunit ScpB [Deltaproteobacteria bacterium]|nr:SMC-Scp complex subunit ScpB [Deltaproteobacteria bacterium]MBK9367028.1 SMC-Scp complex subunit ScpB [Deltaproteobacteria bacterium]MBK9646625.1 SMC-Scp complex subunit ScpB [Deltaproteobacteria bacterium]